MRSLSRCSCDSVALVSSRTTLQLLFPPSAFAAHNSYRRCLPVAHSDFVDSNRRDLFEFGVFSGYFSRLSLLPMAPRISAAAAGTASFLGRASQLRHTRRHGSLLLYRKVRRTQSNHQGEPPAAPAPHPLRPTRPASSASPASPTSLKPMTAPSATFRASGKLATRFWRATHAA